MTDADTTPTCAAMTGANDFAPPQWLRNPHLQSIVPSLALRRPSVHARTRNVMEASREVILDCGDGVRLLTLTATHAGTERTPARDVVVLLHGWEGSANSLYILSLADYLFARGFDVVRLNLRDHGDSHALNEELFHSCRIREVVGAVQNVQRANPDKRLSLVGFSLGGNFAIRVGAQAQEAGIGLHRIVAVCPVLDPKKTLEQLEGGLALYRQYFILKWRRSLRRKQEAWPQRYDFSELLRMDTLTTMTEQLVLRYTDFPSLDDYLRGYAIVGGRLGRLATPTRIIAAADDPIIPAQDLARFERSAHLMIDRTDFGGHCGFYDGRTISWVEREIGRSLGV